MSRPPDAGLAEVLEPSEPERLATGFEFTEGPLWDPTGGFYYFVDIRRSQLLRITPGSKPELVRENTGGGNGTTFDLQGRILMCEGDARRLTRMDSTGGPGFGGLPPTSPGFGGLPPTSLEVLVDHFEGKRLNRPNDVICRSDGSIYFTDPGLRVPWDERELAFSGVYRLETNGSVSALVDCEYANGLAFSPDEKLLYISNSRWAAYIHVIELDSDSKMVRRRIFADMSADDEGVPDGMKVDAAGRVFCTGPGGIWVFASDGTRLGVIRFPEIPANLAFGGPDLRTIFVTARTSVYAVRVKTPGLAHPRFRDPQQTAA